MINKKYSFEKNDEEWKKILSPEEYNIMRKKVPKLLLVENTILILRREFIYVKAVNKNCITVNLNSKVDVVGQATIALYLTQLSI